MNKDDKNTEQQSDEDAKNFTLLYVAIGCFAVSCITFALAFLIKYAGVYMLIASLLCSLAAVSFLNGQKRKAYNTLCKVLRILSYVIMVAALAVFIIGASLAGSAK